MVGDFNINSLDYSANAKVKNFIDLMFSNGLLSVINRPTRITKRSTSCIDHIYINSFINTNLFSGIIETDISDHFPVFLIDNDTNTTNFPDTITKWIRVVNDKTKNKFKLKLSEMDWSLVTNTSNADAAYEVFLKQFLKIYDYCFPLKNIEVKRKSILSPWITRGIIKSSKRKQKLYLKFLRSKTYKNEKRYKNYKNTFERIKQRSKKNHFASLLLKHQNDAKKVWQTMKEAIGKTKIKVNNFPRKIKIDNQEIYEPAVIADSFNTYFTNIGSNLAAKIPHSEKHFTEYLDQAEVEITEKELTFEEFESAFKTLKIVLAPTLQIISYLTYPKYNSTYRL